MVRLFIHAVYKIVIDTVAPALKLKSISPPVTPRNKMIIRLSWTKLPFQISQNWFLLRLLALKRCTFQGLKLTYEILTKRISNFISIMYYIFWELSDHMFSFAQNFKLNQTQLFQYFWNFCLFAHCVINISSFSILRAVLGSLE